jgi:hypothetical protein
MMANQFAKVPIEAIQDARLTHRQLRVLLALLSFAAKGSGPVWAKRETIAARANVHLSHVSGCTAALVKLGWIEKSGDGGHSKSANYIVNQTCAKSEQVKQDETRAKLEWRPTPNRSGAPRAKLERGNKQTIEQTIRTDQRAQARVPAWVTRALQTALPEWLAPRQWEAFVQHRHELQAKLTSPGITRTLAQLDRMRQAGQQPAKVIEQSILKGWTGLFDLATTRTHASSRPDEINSLIAKGERLGVYPKPGESTQDFASRIQSEAGMRVH